MGSLDIIGNPLDEVSGVLVMDVEYLLIYLHSAIVATEDARDGKVAAMPGISGAHHIIGIVHLLNELRISGILLRMPRAEGSNACHKEM